MMGGRRVRSCLGRAGIGCGREGDFCSQTFWERNETRGSPGLRTTVESIEAYLARVIVIVPPSDCNGIVTVGALMLGEGL
jgi:hypothetical protein